MKSLTKDPERAIACREETHLWGTAAQELTRKSWNQGSVRGSCPWDRTVRAISHHESHGTEEGGNGVSESTQEALSGIADSVFRHSVNNLLGSKAECGFGVSQTHRGVTVL